jgi:HD-GYP domain-containing protein (c-di-GMP phosphodiesterase class II)
MLQPWLHRLGLNRLRILWLMLAALLLVSLFPLWFYHRRVLTLSEEKLEFNERLQQGEVTRSLAEQVHLFESSVRQQLKSQVEILRLSGLIQDVNAAQREPQVRALLENFVQNNANLLNVTAVGKQGRGVQAGNFPADRDPFIGAALRRAFELSIQNVEFHSDPLAQEGADNRPVVVMALPLFEGQEFRGMLAAVVSLQYLQTRLLEASVSGREVYLVDRNGRIVAHPDTRKFVPGTDVSAMVDVVARFKEVAQEQKSVPTETRPFEMKEGNATVQVIGTFTSVPNLNWAVIAQRRVRDMRAVAGVDVLSAQARNVMLGVLLAALALGWFFAQGITRPIRGLAESTKAISRGEFRQRAPLGGTAEASELAESFNIMAGNIERYIDQLKQAAEENRELFIGSIRMLAAAIDEKDPYTRGHSGRVAKYSVIIGEHLGLDAEALDKLRIAALLHDVGKIGIDDRVLKKPGALTPEEFEIMKQHPVKGANIMRPVAQLKEMLPGIELHHECVDGKGYPYGLKGEEIPLMARIISVADTLDAITTNRPYQSAADLDFALERVRQLGGTRFDFKVIDGLQAAVLSGKLKLTAQLVEV